MPSLNRIILINTHLQGVVELVVDAHTNICGTNASGKTTLQRLVPVFYGEYPSRVVPSTRDSFERWYLPTEQSFIIYEYERMDGQPCQAVLAAAADGKGIAYRLVRKAFDLADYTRSRHGDTLSCLGMAELGRRLKQADVTLTRLLNTREYRAILQNDRVQLAAGANSGELRAFARAFSLCEQGQALRHIEKLAQAVHSREGKMETVRSMIAAILEEDGVSPPTSRLKPQAVDAWMRESRLIQGFEAMRPEFEQLEREYQDLLACERRLSGLRLGYGSDEPRQQRLIEETEAAIAQRDAALNRLEGLWTQQRDDLNQQRSASKGEITRDEGELEQIEQQYQGFLEADLEQARADLDAVGTWRDDLENLRARYRLLTDQHQDVERDFLERSQRIKDQRERRLDALREQQDALQEQRADQQAQQNDALGALQQRQQAEMAAGQEGFREREVQLGLDRQRLETQIESAGYTEDERQSVAIFERRRAQADVDAEAAETAVRGLETREQQQRPQRDDADAALRAARRQVDERQRDRDAVERLLYPGQHSLLEFLRREQPHWEARLGKLIDPALLQRADLKPALTEPAQDAAFGLQLDLAAIDTPAHAASEQALRQRLQLADDAKKDADNRQQAAERRLGDHNGALETLQRELTVARTERDNRRDDLRRIREEQSAEQGRINEALSERKRKDRKALTALMTRIQQLASEGEQWREDIQSRHHDASLELKAHWQQVIGRIDGEIQRLRNAIDERKQQAQTELDACQRWYQGELKSRGVDEQAIVTLTQQIRQLDERIERAERRRPEVLRFEDWYQHSWLRRKPALQQALEDSRRRAAALDQEFKTATSAFKTERGRLQAERDQAKLHKEEAQEQLNRLKALLRRMGELRLPRDGAPPEGALNERLRQGEEQLYARGQMLDAVKAHVERFDTLIAGNAGSSLAEFWERSRADCMLVGERAIPALDHRKLVPHLEQLLKVLLPQSLTALREQGRLFGIDLNGYYDVLADIDRRIATQSARITREVAEDLSLDGVSDSAVRIRSRITELEFWPDLKAFIQAFRAWQEDDFSGLPGEDYVSSMRRALDIIGRSAQSGGVAGLLEIELRLREGQSDLVIRTDRQLNESSSHGMAYLILCKFLLAFTRMLRGRAAVTIHWPIDELGTLHHHNVKKIFDACAANDIRVLGAFPNPGLGDPRAVRQPLHRRQTDPPTADRQAPHRRHRRQAAPARGRPERAGLQRGPGKGCPSTGGPVESRLQAAPTWATSAQPCGSGFQPRSPPRSNLSDAASRLEAAPTWAKRAALWERLPAAITTTQQPQRRGIAAGSRSHMGPSAQPCGSGFQPRRHHDAATSATRHRGWKPLPHGPSAQPCGSGFQPRSPRRSNLSDAGSRLEAAPTWATSAQPCGSGFQPRSPRRSNLSDAASRLEAAPTRATSSQPCQSGFQPRSPRRSNLSDAASRLQAAPTWAKRAARGSGFQPRSPRRSNLATRHRGWKRSHMGQARSLWERLPAGSAQRRGIAGSAPTWAKRAALWERLPAAITTTQQPQQRAIPAASRSHMGQARSPVGAASSRDDGLSPRRRIGRGSRLEAAPTWATSAQPCQSGFQPRSPRRSNLSDAASRLEAAPTWATSAQPCGSGFQPRSPRRSNLSDAASRLQAAPTWAKRAALWERLPAAITTTGQPQRRGIAAGSRSHMGHKRAALWERLPAAITTTQQPQRRGIAAGSRSHMGPKRAALWERLPAAITTTEQPPCRPSRARDGACSPAPSVSPLRQPNAAPTTTVNFSRIQGKRLGRLKESGAVIRGNTEQSAEHAPHAMTRLRSGIPASCTYPKERL